jgi:hypothetical protein
MRRHPGATEVKTTSVDWPGYRSSASGASHTNSIGESEMWPPAIGTLALKRSSTAAKSGTQPAPQVSVVYFLETNNAPSGSSVPATFVHEHSTR